MPLPCDGFNGTSAPLAQTVGTTQQVFACALMCDLQRELEDPAFYMVVIDALNRIATRISRPTALIQNLEPEDAMNAVTDALCSIETVTITSVDPQKAKAYIIAQLNNLLCP